MPLNDLVQLFEALIKIENASVKIIANGQGDLDLDSFQEERNEKLF